MDFLILSNVIVFCASDLLYLKMLWTNTVILLSLNKKIIKNLNPTSQKSAYLYIEFEYGMCGPQNFRTWELLGEGEGPGKFTAH